MGAPQQTQQARKRYTTKAAWAAAQAAELRERASKARYKSMAGKSMASKRRKWEGIDQMIKEASKFERIAQSFERKGL